MFAYDVMTEQEAIEERYSLLKDGEYEAVVTASQDRVSAGGNPMMDITLQVFDIQGRAKDVRDFLVFTKGMMWKVIHFADSSGLVEQYSQGKLCSEAVIGKRVVVTIGIDEGKIIPTDKLNGKPEGSKYSDKNKVVDYVKKSEQKVSADVDQDVPF